MAQSVADAFGFAHRALELETDDPTEFNDSEKLRSTFQVYGSLFVVLFLIYCTLRKVYPKAFTIRNWAEGHKTWIAEDQYGYFSWLWHVLSVDDDTFLEECNMDHLCLVRIFDFGFRMSLFGMLNALWLMPLYYFSSEGSGDLVVSLTLSNVPSGSTKLVGACIAAWLLVGYAMYLLLGELQWFTKYRHLFLSQRTPRNYTVYIQNIPAEYQSNERLLQFFRSIFPAESVTEANMGVCISELSKTVKQRDIVLGELEHAINVRRVTGMEPSHSSNLGGDGTVQSIPCYTAELVKWNEKVKNSLQKLSLPEEGDGNGFGQNDGTVLTAGFVSFNSLRSVQAALQMTHAEDPFTMEVLEAPDPEDILWENIGASHRQLQLGGLSSFLLSFTLFCFWVPITTFLASMYSLESLRSIKFVDHLLDKSPALASVLALLSPLFLILANAGSVYIFRFISLLERPISRSENEKSVFVKFGCFVVIQNFFVVAVGSGLILSYSEIIEWTDLSKLIDLLATSLPSQSTFFVQVVLVKLFTGLPWELLGSYRITTAKIRAWLGPSLSEKERQSPWLFWRPLCDPDPFLTYLAPIAAWTVFYFMIFFVYSTIAPLTTFFMGLCFLFLRSGYRHQFIYIYPQKPDSGGRLFPSFLRFIKFSILVSELTLMGFLGLKRSTIATSLMVPLIAVTICFYIYIHDTHFNHPDHLPSRRCLLVDLEHTQEDDSFVCGAYIHPDRKADNREAIPENMPIFEEQSDFQPIDYDDTTDDNLTQGLLARDRPTRLSQVC